MRGIDYAALTGDPPLRDVVAWRESVRRHDERIGYHGPASGGDTEPAPAWVGAAVIWAAILVGLCAVVGVGVLLRDGEWLGLIPAVVIPAILIAGLWFYYRRRLELLADGWVEPYRLMAFARSNQLESLPVTGPADLPGRGLAGNRVRHDLVAWTQDGREVEVATESWHSGNPPGGGPPEDAGSCRYLAVHVGEVSPESVLTEEVQLLLTDPAQPREAEVVDGWFLAYDFGDPDPLDVGDWQRNFALAQAVSETLN